MAEAAALEKTQTGLGSLPEAAGARSHGGGAPALLVSDALRAEMFGEEVQLVGRGLKGQLVQLLLR